MGNGLDSPEDFAGLLRGMVADMHKISAVKPIRFRGPEGALPGDILLRAAHVRPPCRIDRTSCLGRFLVQLGVPVLAVLSRLRTRSCCWLVTTASSPPSERPAGWNWSPTPPAGYATN